MSEEEIYTLLTRSVAYRCYDTDELDLTYDEVHDEWTLWYQGKFEVATYSVKTNTVN